MTILHANELWITLGPATLGREADCLRVGATGVRLTFSYGSCELQESRARQLRELSVRAGARCLIVADLAGEKIRLGRFIGQETINVLAGQTVRLVGAIESHPTGEPWNLPVPSAEFFNRLQPGMEITVGDGAATIRVNNVGSDSALAETTSDGTINQTRGLTVRGGGWQPQAITEKDTADLQHIAISGAYDAVAVSFVSNRDAILFAREVLHRYGSTIEVMAKIETTMGVDNIDEIAAVADSVMAARGDLALAMDWIELPAAVDRIAEGSNAAGCPWLLATQVAEGLERFSMPTRAEICDIAQWRGKGCVGVLLSYETAFGRAPVEAVRCTSRLIHRWSASPTTPRRTVSLNTSPTLSRGESL